MQRLDKQHYFSWDEKKQEQFRHDLEWHGNKEIRELYKISVPTIQRLRHKLNIYANPETKYRIQVAKVKHLIQYIENHKDIDPNMKSTWCRRGGNAVKQVRQKDRRRVIMGLEQKSNFKIVFNSKQNDKKNQAKSYLKCAYNYITERNGFTLYYDENTVRKLKTEEYYEKKHRFRFRPVTELQCTNRSKVLAKHDHYVVGEVGSGY